MGRIRGRAWSVLALLSGTALVLFSVLGLRHDRAAPSEFGAVPHAGSTVVAAAGGVLDAPASGSAVSSADPIRTKPFTSKGVTKRRPSTPPPLTPLVQRIVVPSNPGTVLSFPALGIQAPVETVTVNRGVLDVPDNPSHVGWWSGSALPGSAAGTVVVDGHVDSASYGRGALFGLSDLWAGDRVTIRSPGSTPVDYQVVARQVYVKSQGLPADLWTRGGAPRLVLVSCGGPFDEKTLSYDDNVVVFAVPVQHG